MVYDGSAHKKITSGWRFRVTRHPEKGNLTSNFPFNVHREAQS